jgi:hypothetical protein
MDWTQPTRGDELDRETMHRIPDQPGLYLWRRSLPPSNDALESETNFLSWLDHALSRPLLHGDNLVLADNNEASADPKRSVRSKFLTIDGLTVGGGHLSDTKSDLAREAAHDISWRRDFYLRLRDTIHTFGPVFYVGEADSLRDRISTHYTGQSTFSARLDLVGLSLSDLSLQYTETPNLTESERTLLEQCLTHILIAPLTIRAG